MRKLALLTGLMLSVTLVPGVAGAVLPPPDPGCQVFPSDNIWSTDISKAPIAHRSKTWLKTMHTARTLLHPDFGRPPYGIPFNVVDDSYPAAPIGHWQYGSESDKGDYPFNGATEIERGTDRHALIVNDQTCRLYELFAAVWNGGNSSAVSGAVFDLTSNKLRANGWTSADAAGLPIFPGLVRFDEVAAGFIGHAIRFTVDCTSKKHVWPARHDAGSSNGRCPPMGARFRLRKSFSMRGYGAQARVVLTAMKHYGLILADNGSDWYFQGSEDPRWSDTLLDQLKRIPAKAFVAVNTSHCQVSPGSAAASCPW